MIDFLRSYPPAVKWLQANREEEIILPGFVVMELIQGCRSKSEQKTLEKRLMDYGIIWASAETCHHALTVFANAYFTHHLGLLDAVIGQMAVELDCPLYTFNRQHYEGIPNLKIVEPYEKSN
jgi:predicted nucleic acid-binding protein